MDKIDFKLFNREVLTELYETDEDQNIIIKTASHGNCGSRCLITLKTDGKKIIKIDTESSDYCLVDSQVRPCLKGHAYLETFLNKDRILYPMKRIGQRGEGKFKRISWTEALETIAFEMKRIKESYGVSSRYCNYATGYEMCSAVPSAMMKRLLSIDGGFLDYYNNYSNSPSILAAELMYGTQYTGNSRNDYVNSKLIILWGYNPAETACGGNTMYCLLKAKKAGAKIIVIDSRFSDTAASIADQWIAPLPTTDNAISDAMAFYIYINNLHDADFLSDFCLGFDEDTMPNDVELDSSYLSYLLGKKDGVQKDPKWASSISGVPIHIIEQLAIDYATTKPAAILEGYGPGRHAYGEQFSRGLITLACMTGNVGISGGSAAGVGQVPFRMNYLPLIPPLVINPYKGKIPCYSWTDIIEGADKFNEAKGLKYVKHLDTNIKMIFNLAGNCLINQHGDCNRTAALLKDTSKVEFIVCSDIFMTSSAKFADILLPGTSMFETENITSSSSRFEHIFKINPVIEPVGECRFDYDWISELADLLGYGEVFHENKTLHEWLVEVVEKLGNVYSDFPIMKEFTKKGIYKGNEDNIIVAFEDQVKDFKHHPFHTESGKIELFSNSIYLKKDSSQSPIPRYIPSPEGPEDPLRSKYPLQCIGYHTKARTHSIHDNNDFLKGDISQTIWINPIDADKRNINHGDIVLVNNDRGTLRITANVTNRIVKGVVCIPQGAWYKTDENGVDINGCINTITSLRTTPIAKANAQHTNLVEISLYERSGTFGDIKKKIIDYDNCSGCRTCVSACTSRKNGGQSQMLVLEIPTNDENKPIIYQPISCNKCKDPSCVKACPLKILG